MSKLYGSAVRTAKKDTKVSNDPNVGKAAMKNAEIAERSMKFSEDYYNKYVAPMIVEMTDSSRKTQNRLDTMFEANLDQMKMADERYRKYGIPAEDRYFRMVDEYSADAEQERQAQAALGDIRTAQAGAQATMGRRMQALGINPSSPAAISAITDMAAGSAATEAGAMNRARAAARQLGMSLSADAANFGRGGQSGILNFGAAASGNATGGFGVASGAAGGVNAGASVPMAGYNTALKGYGANLDAYTRLAQTDAQLSAQNDAAFGQFLGAAAGAAVSMFSDERAKENIERVGELPNGLPLYTFEYRAEFKDHPLAGPGRFLGVMAQDVLPVIPEAVSFDASGLMTVNYQLIQG